MVRRVLIAIVGGGCSQQSCQEINQCALGNLEERGTRGTENWCVIWKMKNRTIYAPSLILQPDHLQPGSLSVAKTAVLYHHMICCLLLDFINRTILCVCFCVWLLLFIIHVVRDWNIFSSSFLLFAYMQKWYKYTGSVLARKIYCLILCPKNREHTIVSHILKMNMNLDHYNLGHKRSLQMI